MMTCNLEEILGQLANSLQTNSNLSSFQVTVGFDGFVDEIIEVVDKRQSVSNYTRLETISDFGKRILNSAGLSTNIELVPRLVKLGGNGPIMANALSTMGQQISYIGALGAPEIHPVFKDMVERCQRVYSIADPGHTDALEFNDGKIMLGKLTSLSSITWEKLTATVDTHILAELFTQADLVATVNWTMIPYMNQLWEQLLQFIAQQQFTKKPILFVDLADPQKRSQEDICAAMHLLHAFSPYYNVVLGLNLKESVEIANALDIHLVQEPDQFVLQEVTEAIADKLKLWCVVVHATKAAAAVRNGEYQEICGPYCEKPRLTTGAGDNFNAGFCLGLMMNLPLIEVLALGVATSGFYVRRAHSPSLTELHRFVQEWQQGLCD